MHRFRKSGRIDMAIVLTVLIALMAVPLVLYIKNAPAKHIEPPTSGPTPTPVEREASQTKNNDGTVEKVAYNTGRYFYVVEGTVSGDPIYENGAIRSAFVFKTDSSRMLFPLVLDVSNGQYPVGIFSGSFDGAYTTSYLSGEKILPFITNTSPIQLRIMVYPDAIDSQKKQMSEMLDQIINGQPWTNPPMILSPSGVGVVQL